MAEVNGSFRTPVKRTDAEWMSQNLSRMGAALAFYTLFALAPLFVLVLAVASRIFGADAAREGLFNQLSGLTGSEAGAAIQALVSSSNNPASGVWETVFATVMLLVGATGLFIHLQDALNSIWGVKRLPGRGLFNFFRDRLLSFAMIVGIGFLLLISVVLSAALSSTGSFVAGLPPAQQNLLRWSNLGVSFIVITMLFAMIFKVLPDVKLHWRDVWMGALITSLLFSLGKFLIGLYFEWSRTSSAYGAAGSLMIVLLWVYYSAQILFLGAKFTQLYAGRDAAPPEPVPGAQAVVQTVTLKDALPEPRAAAV